MTKRSISKRDEKRPLALSLGEPAGIGADLVLQLYAKRSETGLPPFLVFGSKEFLALRAVRLGLNVSIKDASPDEAAGVFDHALPIFSIGQNVKDRPGVSDRAGGHMVLDSIEQAAKHVLDGHCRALVTAPINKAAVQRIGFKFPGHTEFLAHLCARDGKNADPDYDVGP